MWKQHARLLKLFVVGLFVLSTMICSGVSTSLAQSSTPSIPTTNTITIAGKKYVLVPERTYGKLEKMVDEVTALRSENAALVAKSANDDRVIAKDAELLAAKDKVIEANEKAFLSEQRRADDEMKARLSTEAALGVLKQENADLRVKVKHANQRTLITVLTSAALLLLLR